MYHNFNVAAVEYVDYFYLLIYLSVLVNSSLFLISYLLALSLLQLNKICFYYFYPFKKNSPLCLFKSDISCTIVILSTLNSSQNTSNSYSIVIKEIHALHFLTKIISFYLINEDKKLAFS